MPSGDQRAAAGRWRRGAPAYIARTSASRTIHNTLRPGRACLLVIDELGDPLKNHDVKLKLASGRELQLTTDDQGKIWPELASGDAFTLILADFHEAKEGEKTQTASGQHFATADSGASGGGSRTA